MYDNVEVILDALSEAVSAPTPQLTKQALQKVIDNLKQYLNQLESFYTNLEMTSRPIIEQYREANASDDTISYALFKKLNYSDVEIENLLKTGYILMNEIRSFFTNKTITYQIGLEYRGNLYEKQLTMGELLEYTHVEYNTKSKIDNLFKLRMTNKTGLRESMKESVDTVISAVKYVDEDSTVYSAIRRYVLQSENPKDKNKGNAYEVYRRFLASRNGSNRRPPELPDDEAIGNMFDEVRSNTVASTKGGDYLEEQMKYFGKAPSLVTTSLIRKTLNEVLLSMQNFINSGDNTTFKNEIKNIFIKDPQLKETTDEAEAVAAEKASEYLDKLIASIKI
jgi:hypothetical protein